MSKKKKTKEDVDIGAALANAIMGDPSAVRIPWYKRMFKKSMFAGTAVNRSKYKPHQGEKEKARRMRQIERGILKP